MSVRLACAALLVAIAVPIGAADPASAQQGYLYREKRFGKVCRPPLKFLAGRCVRHCPAGYRNTGGYCGLRGQGSSLGW